MFSRPTYNVFIFLPQVDILSKQRNIVNETMQVSKQHQNPSENTSLKVPHLRTSPDDFINRTYSDFKRPIEKSISFARSFVILMSTIPMSNSCVLNFSTSPVQLRSSCKDP